MPVAPRKSKDSGCVYLYLYQIYLYLYQIYLYLYQIYVYLYQIYLYLYQILTVFNKLKMSAVEHDNILTKFKTINWFHKLVFKWLNRAI